VLYMLGLAYNLSARNSLGWPFPPKGGVRSSSGGVYLEGSSLPVTQL
jgi:hypothetical protein